MEQALIYRISGDYNALHADPEIAAAVGFDRPILHGLCTFGHAARAVYLKFCGDDPTSLRSITVCSCSWSGHTHIQTDEPSEI